MNPRWLALLAILLFVALATFFVAYARPAPPPSIAATSAAAPSYAYLIDVAGWYEITPNESAVSSPLDFSMDNLKALPPTLGQWSRAPYELGPEVSEWFENPDVALSNIYRDPQGHQLWFSVFGSRGSKSYFLFEHTPSTSYPAAGWTLVDSSIVPIVIGDGSIHVQRAILAIGNERRVVFYWYLWHDFNRDPQQGVMTMRLHIPVISMDQDAIDAGVNFLRALFPQVIPWHRF